MMPFDWSLLLTLGILTASIHWTIARAKITQWFWGARWLPQFLNSLLSCPACSGFWLGIAVGLFGIRPLATGSTTLDVVASGVCGLFCTPVVQAVFLWGLERTKID